MSDESENQSSQKKESNPKKPERIKAPEYVEIRESYDPLKEKGKRIIKDKD